jgi:hypothetical protein
MRGVLRQQLARADDDVDPVRESGGKLQDDVSERLGLQAAVGLEAIFGDVAEVGPGVSKAASKACRTAVTSPREAGFAGIWRLSRITLS